jgi:flagellar motor protein MotB
MPRKDLFLFMALMLVAQTTGLQAGEVTLTLSGQSFEGDPAYVIEIGDARIEGAVSDGSTTETISMDAPDGVDEIRILFTNDRFESRERDRNLIVTGMSVDGTVVGFGDIRFEPENAGRMVGEELHLLRNGAAILTRPQTGWAALQEIGADEVSTDDALSLALTPALCVTQPTYEGCLDILSVAVYFGTGSSRIDPASAEAARSFARVAAEAACSVSVVGWASMTGPAALNEAISRDRAEAVAALFTEAGLPRASMNVIPAGQTDVFGSANMNQKVGAILLDCEK